MRAPGTSVGQRTTQEWAAGPQLWVEPQRCLLSVAPTATLVSATVTDTPHGPRNAWDAGRAATGEAGAMVERRVIVSAPGEADGPG